MTHSFVAFSIFVLMTSCGGSGASSPTAAITGNVNTSVAAKPSARSAVAGYALAGATVTVVGSNGNVAATGRTDGNGNYSLSVPQNGVYVVQVVSGGAVLKAVAAVGTTGVTVNVNPASTAALLLLAQKLGAPNMGDKGTQFSSAISGMSKTDVQTAVTDISNTQYFPSVSQLVYDDLKNCRDPSLDLGPGPTAMLVGGVTIGRGGAGGETGSSGSGTSTNTSTNPPSTTDTNSGVGTGIGTGTVTGGGTGTGTGATTGGGTVCFSCPPGAMCPELCWVGTGTATGTWTDTVTTTDTGVNTGTDTGVNTGTDTGVGFCNGTGFGTGTVTGTGTGIGCYPPPCVTCMMLNCPVVGSGTTTGAGTQCPICTNVCPDVCLTGTDTGITTGTGSVSATGTGTAIGILTIINVSSGTSPSTSTFTGTATGTLRAFSKTA